MVGVLSSLHPEKNSRTVSLNGDRYASGRKIPFQIIFLFGTRPQQRSPDIN